jgi:2-desacetyl-2-hydroxyethyl bacteriochlorophyllide A dehydrogenase
MGHEFCGRVLYNGGREDLKKGDRVTALPISPCGRCDACLSGNPQYCLETWDRAVGLSVDNPGGLTSKINVRSDLVIKVPDTVSDEEAAMVEPTAVGLHAIHLADIKVGDKVLVVGSGIIGLVSAMFAKMEGASKVIVSEVNEARAKKAVELGVADGYILATGDFAQDVQNAAPGGFDVVVECCGNAPAVSSALTAVRPGGKIILVGVSMTPIAIPSIIAVTHEITMIGAIAYTKAEFKTCLDLMENKQIDVMKFMSKIVGLDKANESYDELISGKSDSIKIIVDPSK